MYHIGKLRKSLTILLLLLIVKLYYFGNFMFQGYFSHFFGLEGILVIFEFWGLFWYFFRFWGYFEHFRGFEGYFANFRKF